VLTCYFTRRRLDAWLDGALDERAAGRVSAHADGCARCRSEVAELGRLRALLRDTLRSTEPDWTGFWQGVVRGVEDARATRPARGSAAWRRPRWVLSAVAAALVLTVGVWQFMPGPAPVEAGVHVSSARTEDPRATVMVYSTPEQDVAVVWVVVLD
jgi:anti-sigma factor RsiW